MHLTLLGCGEPLVLRETMGFYSRFYGHIEAQMLLNLTNKLL